MDKEVLIERYPTLYHMAENGSWPSVLAKGLLSTKAVLDLVGLEGAERNALEIQHRKESITLVHADGTFVLRDQKPMSENRLRKALPSDISPGDWYRFINSRVFFWTKKERLLRLLGAREYRGVGHEVITVDTRSLVEAYEDRILLCHINSGNTFPVPHQRDFGIFMTIAAFPAKANGNPVKEAVELTIDYAVPDIRNHVVSVTEMNGDAHLRDIYSR